MQAAKPITSYHVMTKPIGPLCNLDCTYCFYLEKEKLYGKQPDWAMPEPVLESYVRQYIESQDAPEIQFAWQGGEPTILGVAFFEKVVELQNKYAGGKRIFNAFQTNGTLLDDGWGEFLKTNNFLVGLSVDGPRELHDYYRVDKGGNPSFDKVMRGLEVLKKHGVEFNTLTCVNRANSVKPLEVYRFLKEMGSGYMQFIPIIERIAPEAAEEDLELIAPNFEGRAKVSKWSVESLQYGKFLSTIFDEWVRADVGQYFVQIFDVSLEAWLGRNPSLCVFSKKCGRAMALEHNGDLYSCDHFVYPENKLGNIMDEALSKLVESDQQHQFGEDKFTTLPQYCLDCEVRFACNGECPKHRFIKTPAGEPGLNYLCAGLKHYFTHVDPYMRFMAQELRQGRPPTNVMQYVRQQEQQQAARNGRKPNEPCFCGSGRKYKKCCGRT
ncbi:MAG: anaerobic sulfatase-maturation protein [Candidatus Hydrogenedentes bacterium]|nr:anaerobic sulfatase-maturation protein [Candidatus Hydrogenedentota bacterium]